MSELTDLEICKEMSSINKSFAKIFNAAIASYNGGMISFEKACDVSIDHSLSLRDEFEVYINYFMRTVKIYNKVFDKDDGIKLSEVYFKEKKEINKAVCLAIIKAFG